MSAATFDTLEAAGIERRQAEAIAGTVRTATAADREALATKADLAELRADMQADLHAAIEPLATKADLAGLRAEIGTIRWSVGLIAAFLFVIGLRVFGLI